MRTPIPVRERLRCCTAMYLGGDRLVYADRLPGWMGSVLLSEAR